MSSVENAIIVPSSSSVSGDLSIPLAAIILLAMSGYLIVVATLLMFRKCLISQGCESCCSFKNCDCNYCLCCEVCDCKTPSFNTCLDQVCPTKEKCAILSQNCLRIPTPNFRNCKMCDSWNCKSRDCDTINCFCCQVSFKTMPPVSPPRETIS